MGTRKPIKYFLSLLLLIAFTAVLIILSEDSFFGTNKNRESYSDNYNEKEIADLIFFHAKIEVLKNHSRIPAIDGYIDRSDFSTYYNVAVTLYPYSSFVQSELTNILHFYLDELSGKECFLMHSKEYLVASLSYDDDGQICYKWEGKLSTLPELERSTCYLLVRAYDRNYSVTNNHPAVYREKAGMNKRENITLNTRIGVIGRQSSGMSSAFNEL